MGIGNDPFIDLIRNIKSWVKESYYFLEKMSYCFECSSSLQRVGSGFECKICGRLFCSNCMKDGFSNPKLCKFCYNAISRRSTDISNFSSPRSSRSDEEEDADNSGQIFNNPQCKSAQDISDGDLVNIGTNLDFHNFKSGDSSLLDIASRSGDIDSTYDNLSVYRNHEKPITQKPLDFENNRLIWDPPLPEDEFNDLDNGYFCYDDDDDSNSADSTTLLSCGSFSNRTLSTREKTNDVHREQLRRVHVHFRALVCQLLTGEGLQIGNENGKTGWLDIVSSLAWQAASYVKPDTSKGSSMDPGDYLKVKRILSGNPTDSMLVKGIVCTKNVTHKRMVSQHKNPRIFLLGGALEFQRSTSRLASINTVLEQEIDHLKLSVSKIEAHRPNVVLVEKSVSSHAQEHFLTKEISLVLNVRRTVLERIAQCVGGQIATSIDNVASARLGHCEMFRVEKFYEENSTGVNSTRKSTKTLMFFEGCPRRLGCTVLLRGTEPEVLRKVKHVVQYATFAAYHLSRETSFLADEGASVPKILPIISNNNNNSRLSEASNSSSISSDSNIQLTEDIETHEGVEENILPEYGSVSESSEVISTSIEFENESTDYLTGNDSQSILVSLSSTCSSKGIVCEPPQLYRIKFYGSFDKPLGRFLRDDLFDQAYSCGICKERTESHVRCYTHQHGSLTISVRRHPSMTLPGERDGRIWMWHRCIKCEHSDGIPPAVRRVVMSDAAWGLSFGKFLELSFSNHSAANRVANCGHSLQKDCLRFYGSGNMIALFRYSPVDILSVQLPHLVLEFASQNQQELAKGEAAAISSKVEILHTEVNKVLKGFEQRIITAEHEPVKTSIRKYIEDLKDLLKKESEEYEVLLHSSPSNYTSFGRETVDILELNRLNKCLLVDSHTWDRRLCLLDSFSKSNSPPAINRDPQFHEVESTHYDGKYRRSPEGLNLHALECNSSNLVETDWSIESVEGYAGSSSLNLVSIPYCKEAKETQNLTSEIYVNGTSLERLQSAGSTLSDKIDSLWIGNPEVDAVGPINLMENSLYKKVLAPIRVNSFDSGLRRDKLHHALPPSSLHLSSVKSFDGYSQLSPRSKNLNFVPSHNPVFLSSTFNMIAEGARLLLPQNGNEDVVIVLYDNEPTTIISYAINSQEHAKFINLERQFSKEEPHFKISFDDESSIPNDKVKFSVSCYFAKQFAAIRKKCCPDEADFLRSMSRCKRWNAQGGKSSAFFAKSLDERFIIKQITKTELDSFESFAPEYFKYMKEALDSGSLTSLAKVLGIYQVTVKHLKGGREVKMDVMVMENLFFGRTLSKVYDLKGSLSDARYNRDTSNNECVLWDLNLLESLKTNPIFLDRKAKRRLERAVWNDTSFLASVDVMDYSLLVGIDDEKKELVIGIIDFMRQYTWDKHLETWVKATGILGGSKNESPTVVSPLVYKKRFRKAMSKYFLTLPGQLSNT